MKAKSLTADERPCFLATILEWYKELPIGLKAKISLAQLHDLSNRLIATQAAAIAEREWRPIETAPKDGSEFWAFNGEQARMKWLEGDEYGLWIYADDLLNDVDPCPTEPTHWQPLMPIPTPTEGADNG